MLVFNKLFYKNKKSKLYFGDRIAVLNDFIYQTGGSTPLIIKSCLPHSLRASWWDLIRNIRKVFWVNKIETMNYWTRSSKPCCSGGRSVQARHDLGAENFSEPARASESEMCTGAARAWAADWLAVAETHTVKAAGAPHSLPLNPRSHRMLRAHPQPPSPQAGLRLLDQLASPVLHCCKQQTS
jgi:hypothetical protein